MTRSGWTHGLLLGSVLRADRERSIDRKRSPRQLVAANMRVSFRLPRCPANPPCLPPLSESAAEGSKRAARNEKGERSDTKGEAKLCTACACPCTAMGQPGSKFTRRLRCMFSFQSSSSFDTSSGHHNFLIRFASMISDRRQEVLIRFKFREVEMSLRNMVQIGFKERLNQTPLSDRKTTKSSLHSAPPRRPDPTGSKLDPGDATT